MTLIDRLMPECALHQIDRIAVAADPSLAYRAVRSLDTHSLLLVRALFELRTLPERMRGHAKAEPRRMTMLDIVRPGSGFMLLGEEPEREIVVGAIGKFWQPEIEFAAVTPEGFRTFCEPGFGKLAWSVRIDPSAVAGSWIGIDLRVAATDPESMRRFERYWKMIGGFSHAIRRAVLRELSRELGPTQPDSSLRLPGDELLSLAKIQATHAVTIEAPPDSVWPWLVQMGCRRGGWYSYDFIDNADVPSADRIVPELQSIAVGDVLSALPGGGADFVVLQVEPKRHVVLGAPELLPGERTSARPLGHRVTWSFSLEPIGQSATRLRVRARAESGDPASEMLLRAVVAPAHEVMQREQLANLKRRAEQHLC